MGATRIMRIISYAILFIVRRNCTGLCYHLFRLLY